jgi:hypothetical protein
MSQFDFDDNSDALTSNNFGFANINSKTGKQSSKINNDEFNDFDENYNETNTKKHNVFNPNEVLSKNNASKVNRTTTPFGKEKSFPTTTNKIVKEREDATQSKKIFNPSLSSTPTLSNYNSGVSTQMGNDELSGFVNMNEDRNTFDPNKPYDPNEETPLLEELGISPQRIKEKIISVITINKLNKKILEDSDMTGPFLIFILFCFTLILQKKTHFGYIYGTTLFGGFIINTLMNLMSKKESILLYNTISVLGYCMIPIVFASFIGILINLKALVGSVTCLACIVMSSYSASNFFEEVLAMQSQKWLIFYPLMLFYTSFLLVTMY